MRIGILTFHRSHNYGAFLQAFALSNSITDMFPEDRVEVIDYETNVSHQFYIDRARTNDYMPHYTYYTTQYRMFMTQLDKLSLTKQKLISDDYNMFKETFGNSFDVIIVGSDEVWLTNGMRGFPNTYWLPGNYGLVKKASYAASSRSKLILMSEKDQELIHQFLSSFSYIGVRDFATLSEIERIVDDRKIYFNPDPVFGWDFGNSKSIKERGKAILKEKFGVPEGEKTLGIMISYYPNANQIIDIAKDYGYTPIALYNWQRNAKNAVLDPFEWLSVIATLDGLVTSFYHGMCFAIKYDTPFVAFEERDTSTVYSKMYDLLVYIERTENYVVDIEKIGELIRSCIIEEKVDFRVERIKLNNLHVQSILEMKNSIEGN